MVLLLSLLAFLFATLVIMGAAYAFAPGGPSTIEKRLGELTGAPMRPVDPGTGSTGPSLFPDVPPTGERTFEEDARVSLPGVGPNPKTGQEVPITPRRVLVFRASNIMKQRINDALARRKAAE